MNKLGVTAIVVSVFLALVFGPLITLWVLNTLFPALAIPYTFWTWLAALVLNLSVYSRTKS
jgi:hypothetical protein